MQMDWIRDTIPRGLPNGRTWMAHRWPGSKTGPEQRLPALSGDEEQQLYSAGGLKQESRQTILAVSYPVQMHTGATCKPIFRF